MKQFPFIIFEDHVIFHTRFCYERFNREVIENYDPDYFITKFGYFIPSEPNSYSILNYLKNPTKENKFNLADFDAEFYLISNYGNLLAVKSNPNTKRKFFTITVNYGKGVRSIHSKEYDNNEDIGALLHIAKDYKHFIELFDKTADPNKFTQRAKITDIAARMRLLGNTINIENCDYTYTAATLKEDIS